jgi:hypothetical protein
MNQWVENYLRAFVTGCQNDWANFCPWQNSRITHGNMNRRNIHRMNSLLGLTPLHWSLPQKIKFLQHRNASGNYRSPGLMHRELYKGASSH